MSLDKERHDARRWLETAEEDLDAAGALIEKEKFSTAYDPALNPDEWDESYRRRRVKR